MAKYNLTFDEAKRERFIKEGRGIGEEANYKPWLTIQDFPSLGRATRVFGVKTQRMHHFFTDLETRYFYLLEWNDSVIDIREQYPLLDIDDVLHDKTDLNFEIFKDKKTGTQYVLSTTFLITTKGNGNRKNYFARSIKTSSELSKKVTLERFEIERRYWESKGIDWGIVTDKEISVVRVKNIEWVYPSLNSYKDRGLTQDDILYMSNNFIDGIHDSKVTIRDFTMEFDKNYNLEAGTGLFIFKYLIALKIIEVDMDKPININETLDTVRVIKF